MTLFVNSTRWRTIKTGSGDKYVKDVVLNNTSYKLFPEVVIINLKYLQL